MKGPARGGSNGPNPIDRLSQGIDRPPGKAIADGDHAAIAKRLDPSSKGNRSDRIEGAQQNPRFVDSDNLSENSVVTGLD
jgi:hypothetical protein